MSDTAYAASFMAAFFVVMILLPLLTMFDHWRIGRQSEKKRQKERERIRAILEEPPGGKE